MIDRLVDAGLPAKKYCRLLGVSSQGFYRYRRRPTSATRLRRQWLTGLIREGHVASRGTYGYRRIHAELTMAMDVQVSPRLVSVLMTQAGSYGLPGPTRIKRLRGLVTADDLVNRRFHPAAPQRAWVTDITEHPEPWIPAVVATPDGGVGDAGSEFTQAQKDLFFDLIAKGGTVRAAARAIGAHEDAAYTWLRQAGLSMRRTAPRKYLE